MQYRTDRYGNPISVLGYGCMRFTQTAGKVDVKKAEQEILEACRGGVNYFDTAYVYPGSEAALGEILERNRLRDKVNIATKLPHYLIKKPDSMESYFQEELRRLRTDHVDYYLMHMLTDTKTWQRLCDLGIMEWLAEKKQSGQIRQVGFSYHGNSDMFCSLLDVYDGFLSDSVQLPGRKLPGRRYRAAQSRGKGAARGHHGAPAGRTADKRSAPCGKKGHGARRNPAHPRPMGL